MTTTPPSPSDIQTMLERYRAVRGTISAAEAAAGRLPGSAELVAVSKTFPAEVIEPLLSAGHRVFGENRVQEAHSKWPELKKKYPSTELHLIGPLQTNKAREAVRLFDVIETLDRPKLAHALKEAAVREGRTPRLLVEVNTGGEGQKAGVVPGEADALVALARDELGLPVEGLMCIPPQDADPVPHFRLLAGIAQRNGLTVLSMGMSADYKLAIACGATHVRVGSAIFGARTATH